MGKPISLLPGSLHNEVNQSSMHLLTSNHFHACQNPRTANFTSDLLCLKCLAHTVLAKLVCKPYRLSINTANNIGNDGIAMLQGKLIWSNFKIMNYSLLLDRVYTGPNAGVTLPSNHYRHQ